MSEHFPELNNLGRVLTNLGDGSVAQDGATLANIANAVVRSGAGVPTGAPDADSNELPLAYDTTLVTGGFYFWNGAAWVKVANIL